VIAPEQIRVGNVRLGDVGEYVGRAARGRRASVLGNPFTIPRDGDRDMVIVRYEAWLREHLAARTPEVLCELSRLASMATTGVLTLVCWCAPLRCHGDVIRTVLLEMGQGLHASDPPAVAIDGAIAASCKSPCQSKRGVAIWSSVGLISTGYNDLVAPFSCTSDASCKAACSRDAVHAEQLALLRAHRALDDAEMLHVKTVAGNLVASGEPSCVQCSKLIAASGLRAMWLYHCDGWRRYDATTFHRLSVEFDARAQGVAQSASPTNTVGCSRGA
jgi:deoxycytidylate deaminase